LLLAVAAAQLAPRNAPTLRCAGRVSAVTGDLYLALRSNDDDASAVGGEASRSLRYHLRCLAIGPAFEIAFHGKDRRDQCRPLLPPTCKIVSDRPPNSCAGGTIDVFA